MLTPNSNGVDGGGGLRIAGPSLNSLHLGNSLYKVIDSSPKLSSPNCNSPHGVLNSVKKPAV